MDVAALRFLARTPALDVGGHFVLRYCEHATVLVASRALLMLLQPHLQVAVGLPVVRVARRRDHLDKVRVWKSK